MGCWGLTSLSIFNTSVLIIFEDPHVEKQKFKLTMEICDTSNAIRLLNEIEPDEVCSF